MNYHKLFLIVTSIVLFTSITGCKKYLDYKPDKRLATPQTGKDLQALLDNDNIMNNYSSGVGEASADDYFLLPADWKSLGTEGERNSYIWGDELFYNNASNQWSSIYQGVYTANVVLENVPSVAVLNETERNAIMASALFYRGNAFFKVAAAWAPAYDAATANRDMGIPLRLNADFNQPSVRSTVEETYQQITGDLKKAVPGLPGNALHPMRPSKAAAYGLLARVYLAMRNYEAAGRYADSCLQLNSRLMDFNKLNAAIPYPISMFNEETIFYMGNGYLPVANFIAKIDSTLYNSYELNDLRKTIYYKMNKDGSHGFYGTYTSSVQLFTGIATDEQYLIKAECLVRGGKIPEGLAVLNDLLKTRYQTGSFMLYTNMNGPAALQLILKERRKELVMRDLRWQDIKRLNKEGASISIKRVLDDATYFLEANSPRFALPLPAYVIKMTGMQQNPR
ncbi:RagB/SusD family nutrient uptake outer membrane protein [Niabella soli]|uniref:Carbohydrate-binding protein SusD n=1 Tax=Niabella soli DSM 19437 TaxID=929713 RepID=W0F1R4_9BACT|nr:RagB/SusD family nutrient uptake outer membrane protein [Niabella soli]AHF16952.1 carbohydrate-binding protein SusD [Niabella soli DSM 19437]